MLVKPIALACLSSVALESLKVMVEKLLVSVMLFSQKPKCTVTGWHEGCTVR